MQTPKARAGTSEVPQKKSPATPRTARQMKTRGCDPDSLSSSPNPASNSSKDRSSKERRSPRSPMSEKKRPGRVQELESQLAQLQEDLKRAQDQLNSSESLKRKAQQEAEEAKKQVLILSEKLEESEQQLEEISASEEARLQELRKISQDRDRAWQSELEAVQKQHSMDSAALLSAMNEIQKLKIQLERVSESEATQMSNVESAHAEIQELRMELAETLSLVEKLKNEISDCKESESRALEVVGKTQLQLETANKTQETLRSDGIKAVEAYKSLTLELEESRVQVKSLEELVSKLQADLAASATANDNALGPTNETGHAQADQENEEIKQVKAELISAKSEVGQLKSALDVADKRYQEEYIQSTLQIRSAYEQLERAKSESSLREAELCEELKIAKADIEKLRASLMDKESQLQSISKENEELNMRIKENQTIERESQLEMELKKLNADIVELKASLMDRETELQNIAEENNTLKMGIKNGEMEKNKITEEAVASAEAARAGEREALIKLEHITEEADKNNRRVALVTEQLDAAQAANSELEAELRRLKVQSDQWRKAAEAAAAMLSTGNNGKYVERTTSLDSSHNPITGKMSSPYSEDIDDDSPKKKNTYMLKKIGGLWKKNH